MAENDSSATEIHVYKPDEQGKHIWKLHLIINVVVVGNTIVIEGEKHWTNNDGPNSSNVTDSHYQKEQIIIENPNDPLSTITHQLEDIHVTVNNETAVPIEDKTQAIKGNVIDTTHNKLNETSEKATELKNDAVVAAHNVQGRVLIVSNHLDKIFFLEKATELKQDATAVAQVVGEKANEAADAVQGRLYII